MATAQIKQTQIQETRIEDKLLVAAIDFGTAYSGYAFSFKSNPLECQTPSVWESGARQLASLKTPTCVLLKSDQSFHSFGYEAENKFAELTEEDDHHGWYFFQQFKMTLYNSKNLSRKTMLDDVSGKQMPAMTIFQLSIAYLKKHLMGTLQTRTTGVRFDDVHVVLTVPAIWGDIAKQFMREAAILAGISSSQLTLALEPEAASMYCQKIPTEKMTSGAFSVSQSGTRYMVLDLGGGTADITAHEKLPDGTLMELHAASGGPWGGTSVNKEFIYLLADIFGSDVIESFMKEETADFMDLMRDFEAKKRTIFPEKDGKIVVKISASLVQLYKDKNGGKDFGKSLSSHHLANNLSWMSDKIRIDVELMKNLFKPSIDRIINHVNSLLSSPDLQGIDQILMVGGYSESPMVHKAMLARFKDKRVIIPQEAGLVVLKGAVFYGHRPQTISSRILRYTYGRENTKIFVEGYHPESHKIYKEGKARCRNVFQKYIECGQSVKTGTRVSKSIIPVTAEQEKITVKIFTSTEADPFLTTDESCQLLGTMTVYLPPYCGEKRRYMESLVFGETEIRLVAEEPTSGHVYETSLDFLG